MSGNYISRIFTLALVIAIIAIPACSYNSAVQKQEAVDAAWGQVQTAYQRRADLIPNLQRSVARFIKHERETLESVTETREGADPSLQRLLERMREARAESGDALEEAQADGPVSADRLQRLQRTQRRLAGDMKAFMARTEDYPELRSGDQFLQLQAQLEGSENRISIARQRYNQAVRDYNSSIRGIPGKWIAQSMGFRERPYFESDAGAADAVELDF